MNILLVEPYYPRKYPPLGLMKMSSFYKQNGDNVEYRQCISTIGLNLDFKPDRICITSLFTWHLDKVCETYHNFKKKYPKADIKIGGVGASAMPEHIKQKTGIEPYVGILPEIDKMPPDYDMSDETRKLKESMVFTTRGCPHKCQYCVVRMIEPEYYEINGWEDAIEPSKPQITIFDNNLLRASKSHIDHVFDVLEKSNKRFDINSGFDVFLFKKEHAEKIANMKIKPIRFAFDKMNQEKALLRCVEYCKDAGINTERIRVYVLFNYTDTVEEACYRANKVIELGCKPFVMNYKPLDWLGNETYIYEPEWTKEKIIDFTYYYNMPVIWNTISYDEFIRERRENIFEKVRHQLNNKLPKEQKILEM